jgi:transcriptional regulator with GAF, ATPase, and Fis domain
MVREEPLRIVRKGFGMVAVDSFTRPEQLGGKRRDRAVQSTIAELAGGGVTEDLLSRLTSVSLALIPGADGAKISVIDNDRLCSIAATSQLVTSLDSAQQAAGHGPCLDAIRSRTAIRCNDLRVAARWPRFAARATAAGVHSVLSSPISISPDTCAALSVFGFRTEAFSTTSQTMAAMLADHASIALINNIRERQFRAALATRDVIGQAKGMIMERFAVDADRAFAMLTTISQQTNTPVRDVAARLAESAGR